MAGQAADGLSTRTCLSTLMGTDTEDKREFRRSYCTKNSLDSKCIVNSFANKGHLVICFPKAWSLYGPWLWLPQPEALGWTTDF